MRNVFVGEKVPCKKTSEGEATSEVRTFYLPTSRNPLNVPFGQFECFHAFLHGLNIIRDPAVIPGVGLGIKDGVGGAGVTVARLAYRTRVED